MSAVTPTPALRPTDILERLARQLLQVYGPTLVVVLTSATTGDIKATAVALITVTIATTVKVLAGLRAKPGDPTWLVIADRAGSAFGLQLAGLGVSDLTGLLSLDWGKALGAALIAGVLALLMYYVTPPSNPPTPVEPSADGGSATVTDISREDVDRAIYGDTTRPHRPSATDGEW